MKRIAVIGAGGWGTALSLVAARAGNQVRLWGHSQEVVEVLQRERENKVYLAGFRLPENVAPTNELAEALRGAEIVLTAVPSHFNRAIYAQMQSHLQPQMIFVNATKGIESETQMRMGEVVRDVLHGHFEPRYVVLSGPSFAQEVAKDEPCAIVAASRGRAAAEAAQAALASTRFR